MPKNGPGEGPHSRLVARGVVDGRSRIGRAIAALRRQLTDHLGAGGAPTVTEKALVDRACWLWIHTALFDRQVAETGQPMSDRDRRSYLAFSNSLCRCLAQLGMKAPPPPPPTLAELFPGRKVPQW